jgi:hypothetical protein
MVGYGATVWDLLPTYPPKITEHGALGGPTYYPPRITEHDAPGVPTVPTPPELRNTHNMYYGGTAILVCTG